MRELVYQNQQKCILTVFPFNSNLVPRRADIFLRSAQYLHISFKIESQGVLPTVINVMACLEQQETAEYYRWLFKIEQMEFEKELLDIVHTSNIIKFNLFRNYFNSFFIFMTRFNQYILSTGFQKNIIFSQRSCAGNSQL